MSVQIAEVLFLIVLLIIILIGCEIFVNGIEWLGLKLGLAERAVGSVLAAIGTAIPETTVPIIAIIFATNGTGEEIAVGAILGAPFMLATIAMLAGGLAIFVAYKKGRRSPYLSVSPEHCGRDARNFLLIYGLAVFAAIFLGGGSEFSTYSRYGIAIALLVFYSIYLKKMLSDDSEKCKTPECLYFARPFSTMNRESPSLPMVILQVLASLGIIIIGARFFVSSIESISEDFGISAIILAFLIAPVATELPEKFNSVIWYWRGKDTLAMGNITGAMVFQGSIPVSIGLVFTNWTLDYIHIISMLLALLAMTIIFLEMKYLRRISYKSLIFSGLFYFVYIVLIVYESSNGGL